MSIHLSGNILFESPMGILPIISGGTGESTADAAFNALAPTQTGNTGKYLTTNGTIVSWATVAGGTSDANSLTGTTLASNVVSSSLTSVGTLTSLAVTGTITTGGVEVGYKTIPQNSQSTAYTLVLADAGKHILHPGADTGARTFTIPANGSVAYPVGTAITFINQYAAGTLTIGINTDTMRLAGVGTTGNRTLVASGIATAIKITSTEWVISGTGLT